MQIRFTQKVIVPGGPSYMPGDVAVVGVPLFSEELAGQCLRKGWAVRVDAAKEEHVLAPTTKAPTRPEVDKMVDRSRASVKTE